MKTCTIDGCDKPVNGHGLCGSHYSRWRRYKDPLVLSYGPTGPGIGDANIRQRFNAKWIVDPSTACWNWTGAVKDPRNAVKDPRGVFSIAHKRQCAARVSWMLEHGAIPNGLSVLHHCDNSLCVNPAHLYLGTAARNIADMLARKRSTSVKLTDEQVRHIRNNPGVTLESLAKMFGVDQSTIWAARKGKTYKYVVA